MFDLTNLRPATQIDVVKIVNDPYAEAAWRIEEPRLRALAIPDGTGGVNPGDRRAIFYLVHHLRARRVLEIGTHVGASTTSIASALYGLGAESVALDTVDVYDVNDEARKPWRDNGTLQSPREMIEQLGLGALVRFVVQPAASYLASCEQTYDLIFLDGDHEEHAVYEEIAGALARLRPGGTILLHDFFLEGRPLWSNGVIADGPYRAVRRMQEEGVAVEITPLGALPWPTKCASHVTSLAILSRNEEVDAAAEVE